MKSFLRISSCLVFVLVCLSGLHYNVFASAEADTTSEVPCTVDQCQDHIEEALKDCPSSRQRRALSLEEDELTSEEQEPITTEGEPENDDDEDDSKEETEEGETQETEIDDDDDDDDSTEETDEDDDDDDDETDDVTNDEEKETEVETDGDEENAETDDDDDDDDEDEEDDEQNDETETEVNENDIEGEGEEEEEGTDEADEEETAEVENDQDDDEEEEDEETTDERESSPVEGEDEEDDERQSEDREASPAEADDDDDESDEDEGDDEVEEREASPEAAETDDDEDETEETEADEGESEEEGADVDDETTEEEEESESAQETEAKMAEIDVEEEVETAEEETEAETAEEEDETAEEEEETAEEEAEATEEEEVQETEAADDEDEDSSEEEEDEIEETTEVEAGESEEDDESDEDETIEEEEEVSTPEVEVEEDKESSPEVEEQETIEAAEDAEAEESDEEEDDSEEDEETASEDEASPAAEEAEDEASPAPEEPEDVPSATEGSEDEATPDATEEAVDEDTERDETPEPEVTHAENVTAGEMDRNISSTDELRADISFAQTQQPKTQLEEEDQDEDEEEELIEEGPGDIKSRDHIISILGLDEESLQAETGTNKAAQSTLTELRKVYQQAIKPLEGLYKFTDISQRQLGDAEIFSKPLLLFLGPWSSGKSAFINYLLGIEYSPSALRTGAEPGSNGFNVIQWGEQEQSVDGQELMADWAFSSLQKYGQAFLENLRGKRMNHPLLEKVTIVDTPGIIEHRKDRRYPFNDVCQWFIDRADIIFVVFDPTKLDLGIEMEAIFDQLKGREGQVRILVNKADTVKPQELMKVQATLLWNLSPFLVTSDPPIIYVGSFWSKPYFPGSPSTLFDAQEDALLHDIRDAIDARVENKVALARRHAVRVRNHAKMVDCYLNTFHTHKSMFGDKKKVASAIIANPQEYNIYEGLSTLSNVSRYDLPDPDIYREFFRVHPLFEFKPLKSTCSYFKGCPLDKLDVAIAYNLPDLVGKFQRFAASLTGSNPRG